MAGFEVTINGRFWVTAEAESVEINAEGRERVNVGQQEFTINGDKRIIFTASGFGGYVQECLHLGKRCIGGILTGLAKRLFVVRVFMSW
jgi:cytoskeletal protein CcmA (bactofilin family)